MHPRKCRLKLQTSSNCVFVSLPHAVQPWMSLPLPVGLLQSIAILWFCLLIQSVKQWLFSLPSHFSASMRLWKSGGRCTRSIHFESLWISSISKVLDSFQLRRCSARFLDQRLPIIQVTVLHPTALAANLQLWTWHDMTSCTMMEQATWTAHVTGVQCKCRYRFSIGHTIFSVTSDTTEIIAQLFCPWAACLHFQHAYIMYASAWASASWERKSTKISSEPRPTVPFQCTWEA